MKKYNYEEMLYGLAKFILKEVEKGGEGSGRKGDPVGTIKGDRIKTPDGYKPIPKGKNKLFEERTLNDTEKAEARKFLGGKPVATVKSGEIKASKGVSSFKSALNWADKHKQEIKREDIGNVIFDSKGVNHSLIYGFGQKKLDAIPAIPDVIKKGKILSIEKDFDGKPQMNVFLAAPIKIGKKKDILFVRLRQNEGDVSRFHVHEVFNIDDIKTGNTLITAGTQAKSSKVRPHRGITRFFEVIESILTVK